MTIWAALLVSTLLALLAIWRHALTPAGTVVAWVFCVIISLCGGTAAFLVLSATLIFTVLADYVAGDRADPNGVRRKSGSRDAWRVICNVGVGTVAILLYRLTNRSAFSAAYVGIMAESLADSLASKLGPLSHRQPVDICSFKPIEAGLSGGITLLGTAMELFGALIIGFIYALASGNFRIALICSGIGFLGATADSIFGSQFQAKFHCSICGAVTERTVHCGTASELFRGFQWVNNDIVNLMSNLTSGLITIFAFW